MRKLTLPPALAAVSLHAPASVHRGAHLGFRKDSRVSDDLANADDLERRRMRPWRGPGKHRKGRIC